MNLTDKRGFTLLEVMIAVAILAISLLALMNFQSQAILASDRAERITVSTFLAQQKMAETLLEIEKGIPKGDFPDEKEEEGQFDEDQYPGYFWKLKIKKFEIPTPELPEGEGQIMAQALGMITDQLQKASREVQLTVGWSDFDVEQEGILLTTHIVNPMGGQ